MSSLIRKNLIRNIIQSGAQNFQRYLNQKIRPQPRLDAQLFRQVISSLKHTAAHHGLISLSAPQIQLKNRIFVILKKELIKYSRWTGYEDLFITKRPEDCYDAIINPQLVEYSNFKIKGDEECPSVDGMKFKVWIPLTNKMSFFQYTEQFERSKAKPVFQKQQQQFTGFYGRVFDHEFRHLEGMLVNLPEICNQEAYLTDQAKQNPQNFVYLRDYRLEREYFNDENFDKYIEEQLKKKQEEQLLEKNKTKAGGPISFDQLSDKIDPKLKEQLIRTFEAAKKKSSFGIGISKPTQTLSKPVDSRKIQQKNETKTTPIQKPIWGTKK